MTPFQEESATSAANTETPKSTIHDYIDLLQTEPAKLYQIPNKQVKKGPIPEPIRDIDIVLKSKHHTEFEDAFSEEVWSTTYKDHNDATLDDTLYRVAKAVASVEETCNLQSKWTAGFYDLLSNFKATSGGRIYSNAGTEWGGTTLMNCFVGPRVKYDPDSLEGILSHLNAQAFTLKSEGGWGENFSYIRPRGAFIHGIGVETPGAVKYMEMFDKGSEIITAGSGRKSGNKRAKGKIRKGAMMGILDIWHPDVIEFITAKQQPGRLTKFNVSVNVTDEFMQKVVKVTELKEQINQETEILSKGNFCATTLLNLHDELIEADKWNLRFPDTTFPNYKAEWTGNIKPWEEKGNPVIVYQTVSVQWLWNLISESTYNRNEPGVLFLDRANYFNPLNYRETIQACNPCGEQMLSPANVCNLGSLNLTQFVAKDDDGNCIGFDLDKMRKYARYLVRFLDNVSTLSEAPLPEYTESMKKKRRIGCGVLGWASSLLMMKVPFGSERAAQIRDEFMGEYARTVYMASIDLAIEKGMFDYCIPSKHVESVFIKSLGLSEEYMTKLARNGIRNSSLLSMQPTGNTSCFANVVSSGIEPIFMPEYIRTVIVSSPPEHLVGLTPKWIEGEWQETEFFKFTKEGDDEILRGVDSAGITYKIDKNRGLTKEVPCEDYGVRYLKKLNQWNASAFWAKTAAGMTVQEHVDDLKGFARWVDSAISKTVNVPFDYPFEDFKNIYLEAYKTGYIKGITTYRSGTMAAVLSAKEEKVAGVCDEEIILHDVKLPESAPATMKILRAEGRKWYLTVIWNDQQTRPFAFFVHTNHAEKHATTEDAVERLLGLARLKGIPEHHVLKVEEKISSDSNTTKLARCISLLLRHGVLMKNIVAVLDKVENAYVTSFLFQIRKFLASYIKDGEKVEGELCLECASDKVVYQEGCKRCISCGSSRCG